MTKYTKPQSLQPRLKVTAGSTLDQLNKIETNVQELKINNENFKGSVFIKVVNYLGSNNDEGQPNPKSIVEGNTMSIMIKGQFLNNPNGDDILFGNEWNHSIKHMLPYGTAAGIKFINLIDPTLKTDLYADKPWALSPYLSTMNYLNVQKTDSESSKSEFKGELIKESTSALFKSNNSKQDENGTPDLTTQDRKKLFYSEDERKKISMNGDLIFTSEFCNGFIDFKTLSLNLPIGLKFPLVQYWDGQPVTFVLRNKSGTINYLYIQFQLDNTEEPIKEREPTSEEDEASFIKLQAEEDERDLAQARLDIANGKLKGIKLRDEGGAEKNGNGRLENGNGNGTGQKVESKDAEVEKDRLGVD